MYLQYISSVQATEHVFCDHSQERRSKASLLLCTPPGTPRILAVMSQACPCCGAFSKTSIGVAFTFAAALESPRKLRPDPDAGLLPAVTATASEAVSILKSSTGAVAPRLEGGEGLSPPPLLRSSHHATTNVVAPTTAAPATSVGSTPWVYVRNQSLHACSEAGTSRPPSPLPVAASEVLVTSPLLGLLAAFLPRTVPVAELETPPVPSCAFPIIVVAEAEPTTTVPELLPPPAPVLLLLCGGSAFNNCATSSFSSSDTPRRCQETAAEPAQQATAPKTSITPRCVLPLSWRLGATAP
mmetsp:Transcript_96701/g.191719  ORF Transcript_96701/g.191719 Transcript_96701/m.191719 type:complete len:298 (+) Transcript_96701:58-951(+)